MNSKVILLGIAFSLLSGAPVWAQQQKADPNLTAQLEKRLAESDAKAKVLTGGPKSLWLLREAKINKIIERLKAGEPVDPSEIDLILSGRVN